jgi:hypothetical protein
VLVQFSKKKGKEDKEIIILRIKAPCALRPKKLRQHCIDHSLPFRAETHGQPIAINKHIAIF